MINKNIAKPTPVSTWLFVYILLQRYNIMK